MAGNPTTLVFGGLGQVGQALRRQGEGRGLVTLGRDDADLTDAEQLGAVLDRYRPAVAFNTAVFQPVDLCETEVARAFAVNALGAGWLAAACAQRDIRLIHLSTDYVFGGGRDTPYSEDDCPAPPSVYARSKLAGEHAVLTASPRHCVVRTSAVYGCAAPGHGSAPFAERMLARAHAGQATRVVDDQYLSPTHAEDLGAALWKLGDGDAAGVFHLAGNKVSSWFDMAERVFELAGRRELLTSTTAAEFGALAPRADYTALRSGRLAEVGIEPLPGIDDGLERHFRSAHPELFE